VAAVSGSEERPVRVIVADDEPDVRLLLRLQLLTAGMEVVGEAADGSEAVAALADTGADAVVLDLLMPGVNGFEAIPRLREIDPDVVIVAYTAVAGDFVRDQMAAAGVTLLLKSGESAPLLRALRAGLAARRATADESP
jgi:CheY-like chemotaxis protein